MGAGPGLGSEAHEGGEACAAREEAAEGGAKGAEGGADVILLLI